MTRAALLNGVDRWRYVPAGVSDLAETRVFIGDANGGISALAIAGGEPLWTSLEASRPLIALDGALLAARNGTIVYLDPATGAQIDAAAAPLPIPANSAWWPTEVWREEDRILIAWNTAEGSEGIAALDVASGNVSDATAERPAAAAPDDLQLFVSNGGKPALWRAGNRMAALAVDVSRGKERLRLVTWNASDGRAIKEKELVRPLPRLGYLHHHLSPDADHVFLLSCNDHDEGEMLAGMLCEWLVFRVSDGKKIAAIPPLLDMQPPFAVAGNRLFFADAGFVVARKAPRLRHLYAIDMSSGQLAWSHFLGAVGRMK